MAILPRALRLFAAGLSTPPRFCPHLLFSYFIKDISGFMKQRFSITLHVLSHLIH